MKTLLALLSLVCVCGCSPNKSLAHRLEGADRVVFSSKLKGYEDLRTTVTGDDVNKVIQVIARGRKLGPNVEAAYSCQLEFFKGSERLETVSTSGQVFWIEGTHYQDTTGTLEKLYEKAREEHPQQFSP